MARTERVFYHLLSLLYFSTGNYMKQPSDAQRWYPHFDDHATHEAFRVAYDRIYELHDKLQDAHAKLDGMAKPSQAGDAGGPSTTKIAGLRVHATPPTNGQKLTFNSATQEIEWQ